MLSLVCKFQKQIHLSQFRTVDEDDIPLAKLKSKKPCQDSSSADIEPLATLRHRSPQVSEESYEIYDSDADPEFQPGKCEVSRCKEDVWAACENCDILVCYDHCVEEVNSCEDHGKMNKKKDSTKRKGHHNVRGKKIVAGRKAGDGHRGGEEPMTDSRQATIEQVEGDRSKKQDSVGDAEEHAMRREETRMEEGDNEKQTEEEVQDGDRTGEEQTQVRVRKRKRDEGNWRRNSRKRLRNSGLAYISVRGKLISGRTMKPSYPPSCQPNCSKNISEDERMVMFEEFWNLADKREQKHFLLRHDRCLWRNG